MKHDEHADTWSVPSDVTPDYSVVIPFYNEAEALQDLLAEVFDVFRALPGIIECICINDGSTDGTAFELLKAQERYGSALKIIRFPHNRGQAASLTRGLMEAQGDIVITMDGDGQNDPADIPLLLHDLEYADLVCGIRVNRNDSTIRRTMSTLANAVRGRVLRDGMKDSGCALKVMRKEVIRSLIPIRTLYSFIPALAVTAGFKVSQRPVNHRARMGGISNYGFRRFAIMPLIDMLGLVWFRKRCILKKEDLTCRQAKPDLDLDNARRNHNQDRKPLLSHSS
jgi:glycosyltransferase involved in cell wall biosynthesis